MILTDFFSPLTMPVFLISLLFFLLLDVVGTGIADLLKFPRWIRVFNWVFGLAILVFVWFIAHFFLSFDKYLIWASLLVISLPFIKKYILDRKLIDLFKEIISFPYSILFLYPVIKILVISISLPPYVWDEMAYHYISPNQLMNEHKWIFTSPLYPKSLYLYQMIPRLLDTAYAISFSVSQTYVVARLIHFFFLLSGVTVIGKYLQKNVSYFSGLIFTFLSFFLVPSFLSASTTGYIDVANTMVILITLLLSIEIFKKPSSGSIAAYFSLIGIMIGIKYTSISFVLANLTTIFLGLSLKHKEKIFTHSFKKIFQLKKYFIMIAILVTVFGGYWYLKNLIISGNPIFPFLFSCWDKFECSGSKTFFDGWATPFTINNYEKIKDSLFFESDELYKLTIFSFFISLGYSYYEKNKKTFYIIVILFSTFFFEVLYSMPISGFIPRYFYHWFIFIIIILSLPWKVLLSHGKKAFFVSTIIFNILLHLFYTTPWVLAQKNIDYLIGPEFYTSEKRSFARGRIGIEDWINIKFPNMKKVVTNFCGSPSVYNTNIADSAMIWTSSEGLLRIFMVNCTFEIVEYKPDLTIDEYYEVIQETKDNEYFLSVTKCGDVNEYTDEKIKYFFDLNQKIICNAKNIEENVYLLSKK